jgi:hypothetical protein
LPSLVSSLLLLLRPLKRRLTDIPHMIIRNATEAPVRLVSLEDVSAYIRAADFPIVLCANWGSGFTEVLKNVPTDAQVSHVFRVPEDVPAGCGFVLMKTFIDGDEDAERLSRFTGGHISPEQSWRLCPYHDPAGYAFPPVHR